MVFQLDEEELASRKSRFSWLLMDYPSRWSLGDEDRCRDESKMLDRYGSIFQTSPNPRFQNSISHFFTAF